MSTSAGSSGIYKAAFPFAAALFNHGNALFRRWTACREADTNVLKALSLFTLQRLDEPLRMMCRLKA